MLQATKEQDLEQQYTDLTDKQQAIIDAHTQQPTATNREKATAAAEILGDTVNESYCSATLKKDYPEVAVYREQVVQGEVVDSPVSRNADHLPGITTDHDFDEDVLVNSEPEGLLLYLPDWYVQELIESSELPPELHERVVDEVVGMAFDGED